MQNDEIQKVSKEVVEKVLELLKEKVYRIILYGSYARGNFEPESDFDVMILLNCSPEEILVYRRAVSVLASEISLENGIEVSLLLKDRETYEQWLDTLVFYQNVEREGLTLYGNR